MAILSAIRQNTEVEAKPQEGLESPMVLPPSTVKARSTSVSEADYLGISGKKYTAPKTQGFFKSFVYGDDKFDDVEESTAGKVGDVIGSVFRIPAQKIAYASLELWDDDVKAMREGIDKLRLTDPEMAAQIEYESGFGARKTTAQNVTQLAAGVGEGILTAVPLGLLGKAGRVGWAAKEASVLSKAGTVGRYASAGLKAGSTIGQRLAAGAVTGGAYGGMYGFLAGLQEGGDWGKAFKNIPAYSAIGATFGAAVPGALGLVGGVTRTGFKTVGGAAKFVAGSAPDFLRPSNYFKQLPTSLQRMILTEGSFLRSEFGEVGNAVVQKFNKARAFAQKDIGVFQEKAVSLGMLEAPSTAKGAYKDVAALRERWKDREFRFAVRDALTHEGIFADDAIRAKTLAKDKHMNDIVEFFDGYRKDKGLLAQQQGITDNLLDIDKYFSKYTPQVGLSGSSVKKLANTTDDATREAIYAANNEAVDDMIEYGFRRGDWKTKAEGFKNYYDAMDAALNLSRVSDTNNAYFKWLVDNGHAKSLAQARAQFIGDLDAPLQRSLTPRTVSLDYQRKTPMPWSDPDPMRVMSYYVKKADERIATAAEFGVNDEVLKDMKKFITASNRGQAAGDDFEKAIRSITGQVARAPKEMRWSAIVRGIETFHLAFSQIINVSTQLNYLISSDMRHWGYGFKKAFEQEGMRESVKRGVFISDMVRQTSPYQNFGDKITDRLLKHSGFTYTEMLNRATGIGVSKSWAEHNVMQALKKMGREVSPDDIARANTLLKSQKEAQRLILQKGYENTGKYAREFAAKFPDEEFAPVAGNIGLAESRLAKLEPSIAPKIQKLQNTRKILEGKLLAEGKPLTDADVLDLQETINIFRQSIDTYTGGKANVAQDALPVDAGDVQEALDGVIKLRRSKMEKIIEGLEEQFDEARALGQQEPTLTATTKPLTPEQKLVKYNNQIKDIDESIISLQNELTDKERLLNGIIDAYKIADTQVRKSHPEGFMYDDFIKGKKGELGEIDRDAAANLRELGLDPEEVIARGGLSDDDYTTAAQTLVESTQGGNNPMVMPGMSRTPWGKVMYQFKSFAYMQAQFIGDSIKRDLVSVAKNPSGAGAYRAIKFLGTVGVLYPITYGALRDVRDIVTLKKSPDDAFELNAYFEGLGMFSAGGLFVDFMKSAQQGGTEGFILGPGVGDVIKYLEATVGELTQLEEASLKPLRKQLLNQTGVGQILNNLIDK